MSGPAGCRRPGVSRCPALGLLSPSYQPLLSPGLCHPDPPVGAAECPGRARCSPAGNSGRHFPASRNRFLVYSASCTPSCVTEVAPRSSLPADGSRTAERWAPHASLCCHGRGRAQRGARTSRFGFPRLCRRDGAAGTKGPLRRTGRALVWKGRSHGRLLPGGGRGAARVCPGAQWSPAGGFRSRQQSSQSRALPQGPAASAPPSPRPEAPVLALRCPGASGSVPPRGKRGNCKSKTSNCHSVARF